VPPLIRLSEKYNLPVIEVKSLMDEYQIIDSEVAKNFRILCEKIKEEAIEKA